MAVFAVYIEKQTKYGGEMRKFGNTYHYSVNDAQVFPDRQMGEAVAAAERQVTSGAVEFLRWVTWGPTDGAQIDSVIRDDGPLEFTGLTAGLGGSYREACSIVSWPLPRSEAFNRKRFLRKFLRMAYGIADTSANVQAGIDPYPESVIDDFNAKYTEKVRNPILTLDAAISTPGGDVTTGEGTLRPYVATRQIGR